MNNKFVLFLTLINSEYNFTLVDHTIFSKFSPCIKCGPISGNSNFLQTLLDFQKISNHRYGKLEQNYERNLRVVQVASISLKCKNHV